MFIDRVEISVSSGKGGAGCVSFRREKFVVQGGPDGGDGGRGGDLVFVVDPNCDTLSNFRGKRRYKAPNGEAGGSRNKTGRSGGDLELAVPPGTQVIDKNSGEILLDLVGSGDRVIFLEGGKGGFGNPHFKGPTNQRPIYAQKGLEGESREIFLELKLIADVGLVGFPNVGKSTLISRVSHARPEIANYEFTTLTPHLGVVRAGEYSNFVMADIPGIIEGASDGKGLGLEFLRHIERTRILLFVLDVISEKSLANQYALLRSELEKYSEKLAQKTSAIVFSKIDADMEGAKDRIAEFFALNNMGVNTGINMGEMDLPYFDDGKTFAIAISSVSGINIKEAIFKLNKMIEMEKNENRD